MNSADRGELTRERILEAINTYINEHQYPPTIREVCELVGLKSPSTVFNHLEILKERGLLESDGKRQSRRAIRVPKRTEDYDALFLAKCKEVNELKAQVAKLKEQLKEVSNGKFL